jgi:hypothetical protein
MWYRVQKGWYGCHYVRKSPPAELGAIPKIKSRDIEDYREAKDKYKAAEKGPPAFYTFWAKRFTEALSSPSCEMSPLNEGLWQLVPGSFSARMTHQIVEQSFDSGHASFDSRTIYAFLVRRMSPETSGRVKWWRKKAREGLLPPVLLWRFSGLDSYVVLDGHDRLLAAALEDQPIDSISLVRRQAVSPEPKCAERLDQEANILLDWDYRTSDKEQSVRADLANRMLVEAHTLQLRDAVSNNMVGSVSMEEWKEGLSEVLTKAYGNSINAESYGEIFELWGEEDDNDFWESLLDKIPYRFLQTWKD